MNNIPENEETDKFFVLKKNNLDKREWGLVATYTQGRFHINKANRTAEGKDKRWITKLMCQQLFKNTKTGEISPWKGRGPVPIGITFNNLEQARDALVFFLNVVDNLIREEKED